MLVRRGVHLPPPCRTSFDVVDNCTLPENFMKRYGVNKSHASKSFRRDVSRTRMVNVAPKPMRGGYRL